jgi:hypothetical protein
MDPWAPAPHLPLHPLHLVSCFLHLHYLVPLDPALGHQVSRDDQYAIAPMPITVAKVIYRGKGI